MKLVGLPPNWAADVGKSLLPTAREFERACKRMVEIVRGIPLPHIQREVRTKEWYWRCRKCHKDYAPQMAVAVFANKVVIGWECLPCNDPRREPNG